MYLKLSNSKIFWEILSTDLGKGDAEHTFTGYVRWHPIRLISIFACNLKLMVYILTKVLLFLLVPQYPTTYSVNRKTPSDPASLHGVTIYING